MSFPPFGHEPSIVPLHPLRTRNYVQGGQENGALKVVKEAEAMKGSEETSTPQQKNRLKRKAEQEVDNDEQPEVPALPSSHAVDISAQRQLLIPEPGVQWMFTKPIPIKRPKNPDDWAPDISSHSGRSGPVVPAIQFPLHLARITSQSDRSYQRWAMQHFPPMVDFVPTNLYIRNMGDMSYLTKAHAQKVFEILGAETDVLQYLYNTVSDPYNAGAITKNQFIQAMWLLHIGCRDALRKQERYMAEVLPRYINHWTTCDVCSRMLVPGYHTFGCKVCVTNGVSQYYVCQTCLKAGRVCRHGYQMEENELYHHPEAPSALSRPRVLDDGETKIYFECDQCHQVLPAGSTTKFCSQHAGGNTQGNKRRRVG
ncbi:hypothetical protein CONLIGDRAFT_717129 [Coniochaeta ligniaria NRRL 30616]|uniref:Uncharacterized protein n=1 Tax=Coniochaeta ligniaria NRRL 30616 TaxID=1408157 RepID=A0A1J7JB09_9PEZI|nr:hypothetical protein CONLIGDRAFT_717129 [Coniochaeta ligniaria NRRL 30616]